MGGRWRALAPSVHVGVDYATTAPVLIDGARVTLANGILWVDGCPHSWELGPLALRPCVRLDVGVRVAASDGIPNGHSELRPWLDIGAMMHLRTALGGPAFLDLGGGLLFPVVQDRVYLSPDVTVYTVHVVGGRGDAAVGVEFR
jgi:hypothetical protein